MHEYCFFVDSVVRPTEAGVSLNVLFSASALYGKGIFTTARVKQGRIFLWEKHWDRLLVASKKLRMEVDQSESFVKAALDRLIVANKVDEGRTKITILDISANPFWIAKGPNKYFLLITTSDPRPIPDRFLLTKSPFLVNSTSPLAGLKSCNYLEQLMAFADAKSVHFDEAIRCNELGYVASACMANVFWENDGRLFTPSLVTGCLAGTTREFVLENLECAEVEAGIDAIEAADRIFLTSAGIGVVAAAEFNGRKLDTSNHPILNLIPN